MRHDRRQDLLLTLVMLGIALTPAWLLPAPWSTGWGFVVVLLGAPAVWWSWTHAPWQPTPKAELHRVLGRLALTPDMHFCDLGAGDGRLVVAVHRATGAACTGLEAAPLMFVLGWIRTRWTGTARTHIRLADLYQADLTDFDVLYVWGTAYSVSQERFGALAAAALARGARLVSYHHPVAGLTPTWVDAGGLRPLFGYEPDNAQA